MNKKRTRARSVSVRLSAGELAVLKRLSFAAKRTGGRKLPVSVFLRALVRFLGRLKVDLGEAGSVDELERRLRDAMLRKGGRSRIL